VNRWVTLVALAVIVAATLAFRPVPTPGPFLRDFEAYWSAGSAWSAQADPYARTIWSVERGVPGVNASRDELLPFVGPPVTLLAWSAMARLPYAVAVRLWLAVLVLAAVALVAIVVRASARPVALWAFLPAGALAIAFGPITSDLALGQVALVAFLAATLVARPLRLVPRAVAAFVALFQPNVAFGLVSQLGRNTATLAIVLGGLASYATAALLWGWRWPATYLRQLLAHESAERLSAIQLTPAAIAHGAGMPPGATQAIAFATVVVALATAFALWRRIAEPFARFAAIAPLAPFASSFFHEHDLVVAYAAAGWCALRARGTVRAIALAATLLVAIDWLGLAQRPTGLAQSALLAAAAALAFIALGETSDWRATAAAIGTIAAIFAYGAWLAIGHPAPVWPDALGNFHAAPTASIAEVWRDEQRRTGLLGINPVWAFLRELSLFGCALLSLSVYLTSCRPQQARYPR
jgi:hypothetical protein